MDLGRHSFIYWIKSCLYPTWPQLTPKTIHHKWTRKLKSFSYTLYMCVYIYIYNTHIETTTNIKSEEDKGGWIDIVDYDFNLDWGRSLWVKNLKFNTLKRTKKKLIWKNFLFRKSSTKQQLINFIWQSIYNNFDKSPPTRCSSLSLHINIIKSIIRAYLSSTLCRSIA